MLAPPRRPVALLAAVLLLAALACARPPEREPAAPTTGPGPAAAPTTGPGPAAGGTPPAAGVTPRAAAEPARSPGEEPATTMKGPGPMTASTLRFTPGPALEPAAALLAWLDEQGRARRHVRLPVVILLDEHRLAVASARVGVAGAPAAEDAIRLALDDTALGIALIDRVRGRCPGARECAVTLEGLWGRLLAGGPGPAPAAGHPFAVTAVRDAEVAEGGGRAAVEAP